MNRLLWVMMVCVCVSPVALARQRQGRPNIVWLVTEDNSHHWNRLYHEHGAHMPNVERLAEGGLVFNRAYSCAPVCSVARSTIISGCYATRLGAQYHRAQQKVSMPDGIRMFPWYLRQAGYYTTNNSKEDYNFLAEDKQGVWDVSSGKASYRKRAPGQPFFHVQNYGHTHEGKLFGNVPDHKLKHKPKDMQLFPYHPDTSTFRNKYALYLDKHVEVDKQLGQFIDQLEADGLLDDTFIFYYGDHGGVLPGSKGYAYNDGLQIPMVVYIPKNFTHLAPATRGSRINGTVEFVDLSATVLNLAGVTPPEGIDGKPFLGRSVELAELNRRDTALGYAERFDEKLDLVRTLHKGKYHYMRNYQPFNFDGLHAFYRYKQPAFVEWLELYKAGKLNAAQSRFFEPRPVECLYDLEQDPHEVNNLAVDPKYAKILEDIRTKLQQRLASMPDLGFIPEPVFLTESEGKGVTYGQENKEKINRLMAISDLQLRPFVEVKNELTQALSAGCPLERYWGLIVCSAFGNKASLFYNKAHDLARADENHLVRMRAAEFLALTGQADPRPVLVEILNKTTDPVEANLILNTVVLLRDGEPGYPFDVKDIQSAKWMNAPKVMQAQHRIAYLRETQDDNTGRKR